MPPLRIFVSTYFFILGITYSPLVKANEIVVFTGSLSHKSLGGCCADTGSQRGFGVLGRVDFGSLFGITNLLGYSDGRWSEGAILRPFDIKGSTSRMDHASGAMVQTKFVSQWRVVAAVGLGTFTYTGRTKDFDLPIRISGLQLINSNQVFYSLTKDLSLVGLMNLSFALSSADQSLLLGLHLGLGYDF